MGGGFPSVDVCLSRLSVLLSGGLVESSEASANFSKLRLTDEALLNNNEIISVRSL